MARYPNNGTSPLRANNYLKEDLHVQKYFEKIETVVHEHLIVTNPVVVEAPLLPEAIHLNGSPLRQKIEPFSNFLPSRNTSIISEAPVRTLDRSSYLRSNRAYSANKSAKKSSLIRPPKQSFKKTYRETPKPEWIQPT